MFHEGVIRVDVDEARAGGSHIHMWVPATAVQLGLYAVPRRHLERPAAQVAQYLPLLRELTKELKRYPNAEFVDVTDGTDHVHIGTVNGKIQIDAVNQDETIHVRVPVETLEDITDRIEVVVPTV